MTTETTLKDRTITLTCTPTLIWYGDGRIGARVEFAQTAGEPNGMNGRVDRNGNIRLTNMPTDANYNDNVDVTILLDTSKMKDQGQEPVVGRWATASEYSGTGPVTGFCWFCGVDANGNYNADEPITIPGMSAIRSSDTQVVIDDDTVDNGPSYAYCLGLVLPGYNNYYITLDPRITSKNTGINSFMLKE